MTKTKPPTPSGLAAAGKALPSQPVTVFAEDFSLIARKPDRLRLTRYKIRVLS
jgi:hypothetical protein